MTTAMNVTTKPHRMQSRVISYDVFHVCRMRRLKKSNMAHFRVQSLQSRQAKSASESANRVHDQVKERVGRATMTYTAAYKMRLASTKPLPMALL